MKPYLFLLLTIGLMSLNTVAQTTTLSITGKVSDCVTHEAIEAAILKLWGDDGSAVEIKSNKLGIYKIDSTLLKPGRKYALDALAPDMKHLGSTERIMIGTLTSTSHLIYNICLPPNKGCVTGE